MWGEEWDRQFYTCLFSIRVLFIMGSSGYKDFIWAVEFYRFGLELVGLWPLDNEVFKKKLWLDIRASFVFIIIIFTGVSMVWALTRVWGDMELMIDNLRVTLPTLAIMFKFIIIRQKRKVVLSILNMMAEDWIALKLNTEREVMLKKIRSARLFVICGYVLVILALIMGILFPCFGIQFRRITNLTDRNKPLPLSSYYFYDTDKSPQFELTLLLQSITSVVASIIYLSVDAFLGLIIFHICGQLENFRHRLTNLVLCKNFHRALNNCVMCHLRLIRFAKNIESIFSLMILGLIFYFCVIFCLCGFLLITVFTERKINDGNILQASYMIIFALILLSHTFLYCGAGELVTGQCEAVYRAICDLKWYKLESKKAGNLLLLMIRANEPIRITAGKIIPLKMTTFCSLLKTSAGYISFLLAKST